jgi:hypothetical protein
MIPFIEKIWFLWWMVAIVFILRWFCLFSSKADEDRDATASAEEKAAAGQFPSGSASSLFV